MQGLRKLAPDVEGAHRLARRLMTDGDAEGLGTIDAAPAAAESVAAPGAIPYQAVTNHELERFDTFLPPIPIAVAGVFAGIFLSTVAGAIQSVLAIGSEGIGFGDAFLAMINALSLGVAATAAVFAVRGKSEIRRMLAAIRRRARITIPPEAETPTSA